MDAQESDPTVTVDVEYVDLSEDEERAVLAVLDASTEMAEVDQDKLAELLDGIAFESDAIDELIGTLKDDQRIEVVDDGDSVPEVPVEPVTKPGDLWLLGDHRLLCGDSTNADDVARLMDGKKADLWLTDPPYNVALGINETPKEAKNRNRRIDGKIVSNDNMNDADFRQFLVSSFSVAFAVLKPGASFYVWHADSEGYNFRGAIHDCGEIVRQCLIWQKNYMVMGRQDYHWQHEPCLYGWKKGASHGWYSDRKQTTVLQFDRPAQSPEHPTMKPVPLFAYLIGNSTAPQGLVFDSFLGSGTTLIASNELGRTCYGMELSPQYCDVIVERWENLTGEKAICQSTT